MMYSIQERDIWSLFRLRISNGDAPVGEPEQLLSGPGLLGHVAAIGNVGRLVYAVTSLNEQIFEIPVDNQGNRRGPVTELPLTEGALYFSPSASRDGRSMVYTQEELGKHSIILRDFAAGTNRVIEEQSQTGFPAASIAPDGSKIVFNRHCWCQATVLDCPSFLVPATGGQAKRICENCTPRGFSSDGSFILMQHYAWDKNEDKITAVELAKNRERDFARSRSNSVYHAFLSWDDRWVAFKKLLGTTQAQILIAQVRDGHAAAESEWIVVTDGHSSDDKPQFSPDGNSVYFTSDRDGYLCIWKQRLDPLSKHPVGSAMGYEHFHNSMGRDAASDPRYLFLSDLTVARDKILINLPRGRGDIWMAHVN